MTIAPSSKDRWVIEEDKISIPLINTFEGGESSSKYYIESVSK